MNRTSKRKKLNWTKNHIHRADERQQMQMQNIQFFKVHFDCKCKCKHQVRQSKKYACARTWARTHTRQIVIRNKEKKKRWAKVWKKKTNSWLFLINEMMCDRTSTKREHLWLWGTTMWKPKINIQKEYERKKWMVRLTNDMKNKNHMDLNMCVCFSNDDDDDDD